MKLTGKLSKFTLLLFLLWLPVSVWGPVSVEALTASSPGSSGNGVGNIPQGTQSDNTYAASYKLNKVSNVFATTQKVSCYRPEVAYFVNDGPNDGYSGMSECASAANSAEDIGNSPYPTQANSKPGYPAPTPMLVKGHAESDLRVDPTNPNHLIGSSKWLVSAEGYNHQLGFYESFDGGQTWPVQGHIPGYEGWTDDTDPVGAFDSYGNYYELHLPYQFSYDSSGGHDFQPGALPNPTIPAEVIAISTRPHGSTLATQWNATHNGQLDIIANYHSTGNSPDKQWITIDTNPQSPFFNTIYAMWVDFNGPYGSKPLVSTARALSDGTHTDWSSPLILPTLNSTSADTYLLPHVDPSGTIWTSVTNFPSRAQRSTGAISVISSSDGGLTWQGPQLATSNIVLPPANYSNTTFRSGILNTFAVGQSLSNQHHYPLYVSWEDYSTGFTNVMLSASYDGGQSWSAPIQVNDNQSPVDEFQPNLTVASNGTVSVAWYDRRLACAAAGSNEAVGAGIALDQINPNYTGSLPPYGAVNYCVNSSVQFYSPTLSPKGQNIRLTQHSWDPQLNSPHSGCATCLITFIGDYFGNTTGGSLNFSTFVSTYNDGTNPFNRQQQVIATVAIP